MKHCNGLRWAYPCVDARPSSASGRNELVWLRSGSVLSDSLKVRFQVYVEVVRLCETASCLGEADSSIHALGCSEKEKYFARGSTLVRGGASEEQKTLGMED